MADGRKQPFYISSRDGNPLSFAGIWDSVTTGEGGRLDSCAILTTDCNALMQPLHDRMPVVLSTGDWDAWLDPGPSTDEKLLPLLKPFAPDLMQLWAVSPAVGRVSNQGEELLRPVSLMAAP
jgi:putative SOS response-associated peptidase YedK